jgi:hypothetical protein
MLNIETLQVQRNYWPELIQIIEAKINENADKYP